MRRYWLEESARQGELITISDEALHHIRDVCRLRIGAKFEVIISGSAHLVEITSESKNASIAKIIQARAIAPPVRPHLVLALSIPRFAVFEAILEKAVELGVIELKPFFSDFSFLRTQDEVWQKKVPRFQKIITSATQQSGRGELLQLAPPLSLKELLATFNRTEQATGLFAYEGQAALSAKDGVSRLRRDNLEQVWVFVGSEGGFSDMEVETFRQLGLPSVTLGAQVLRVETACVALLSIIKYELDLMRSNAQQGAGDVGSV